MKTDRQKALEWWNLLRKTNISGYGITVKDRGYYTNLYFGINNRMHQWLTDQEIEAIWKAQHTQEKF